MGEEDAEAGAGAEATVEGAEAAAAPLAFGRAGGPEGTPPLLGACVEEDMLTLRGPRDGVRVGGVNRRVAEQKCTSADINYADEDGLWERQGRTNRRTSSSTFKKNDSTAASIVVGPFVRSELGSNPRHTHPIKLLDNAGTLLPIEGKEPTTLHSRNPGV